MIARWLIRTVSGAYVLGNGITGTSMLVIDQDREVVVEIVAGIILGPMIFPALAVSRLPKQVEQQGVRDSMRMHSEAM